MIRSDRTFVRLRTAECAILVTAVTRHDDWATGTVVQPAKAGLGKWSDEDASGF
jgi:hypothetical protein